MNRKVSAKKVASKAPKKKATKVVKKVAPKAPKKKTPKVTKKAAPKVAKKIRNSNKPIKEIHINTEMEEKIMTIPAEEYFDMLGGGIEDPGELKDEREVFDEENYLDEEFILRYDEDVEELEFEDRFEDR